MHVLEAIALKTALEIDFGGGIKTRKDLETAFNSGAEMVTGGSIAVRDQDMFLSWLDEYGPEKIILGADHRDQKISVTGWTEDSGQDLFGFVGFYVNQGIER